MIVPKDFTYADAYEKFFKVKENPDRLVAKLYSACGKEEIKFKKSIIIPTEQYPLSKSEFRVFHHGNCKVCEDEKILKCFDETKYEQGHCYQMADELKLRLIKAGYDAKIYVGWLFPNPMETPIHHAWIVVDDYVLDLQDDMCVIKANWEMFEGKTTEECRYLLAEFHTYCYKNKVPHSTRCAPVGLPCVEYYYIGSEVECGDVGRKEYNQLLRKYPNHDCGKRIVDKSGATRGQILTKKMMNGEL